MGPPPSVAVVGTLPGWRVPRLALADVLRAYLAALGMPQAGVTLLLVDEAHSARLNARFRRKPRSTDVLSFPALEGRPLPGFDGYLGDLALCPRYAWKHAGRFDPDFGGEVAFLLLHGLLHLAGRHHDTPAQERAMWRTSRSLHPVHRPWQPALRRLRPLKKRP